MVNASDSRQTGAASFPKLAAEIAGWKWLEGQLFEIVGGWVSDATEPQLKMWFSAQSLHHAWRAEQWAALMPVLPDVELAAAQPVNPGLREVLALLDSPAEPHRSAARSLGLLGVMLPAVVDACDSRRARCEPLAEAPLARVLDLVRLDSDRDLRIGRDIASVVFHDPDARAAAETHREAVASLLHAAGGLKGSST